MSKEILLITNYFPPEKGAAPNRLYSMAIGLAEAGYKVRVVCPLPNYPHGRVLEGYRRKLVQKENVNFGKITRLWVLPSNSSNKLFRLLSMFSFCFSLLFYFLFSKTPKKILIQYSPVFVGFTAVALSRLFSNKIILNISDLWPLAGLEMGVLKEGWQYSRLLKMEKFCYRHSDLIIGQSNEILQHISILNTKRNLFLYRNIPNFEIDNAHPPKTSEEIKFVYAGLLGLAQGVNEICERINFSGNTSLHIYGSGPTAEKIKSLDIENVFFHGELEREELHSVLQEYDIAFIPLIKRIYGSVPSKIFEYSRLGLPLLYFAGGEGEKIVEENTLGWVIPVNDYDALQEFVNTISENDLSAFPKKKVQKNSIETFDFDGQFKALLKKIDEI